MHLGMFTADIGQARGGFPSRALNAGPGFPRGSAGMSLDLLVAGGALNQSARLHGSRRRPVALFGPMKEGVFHCAAVTTDGTPDKTGELRPPGA